MKDLKRLIFSVPLHRPSSRLVDHVGDHAPHLHAHAFRNLDGLEAGVFGQQETPALCALKPLHRELAFNHCDDDIAGTGFEGLVHDEYVTRVDARLDHGGALRPHEEGG